MHATIAGVNTDDAEEIGRFEVVPGINEWYIVDCQNGYKPIATYDTRSEAINAAKRLNAKDW